jgi:hypothetical protein
MTNKQRFLSLVLASTVAVISGTPSEAMPPKGKAALQKIIAGKQEMLDAGLYIPLNPTDPTFAANASCSAYFLLKELEVYGTDMAKQYKAANMRYFAANTRRAKAKGYDAWEPATYALRQLHETAPSALKGHVANPASCQVN